METNWTKNLTKRPLFVNRTHLGACANLIFSSTSSTAEILCKRKTGYTEQVFPGMSSAKRINLAHVRITYSEVRRQISWIKGNKH